MKNRNERESKIGEIDLTPALNGRLLTQEEWVEFFNRQEGEAKGKRMISAPDMYRAVSSAPKEVLESLRRDFNFKNPRKGWQITSTRVSYNPSNLSARIIQNFGSAINGIIPIETFVPEVPYYEDEPVTKVIEGKGLAYVRALFDTEDSPSKILQTLEQLSQRSPKDICFYTQMIPPRKGNLDSAVRFIYNGDEFLIDGLNFFDYNGLSRGIAIEKK